jgi:hypothetical protein
LISELPEGFDGAAGLPGTGLDWPVVAPGEFPAGAAPGEPPPLGDAPPDMPAPPPAEPAPPAPPACASASELESASAPANANVASFMVVSLVVERDQPGETTDVPALICEAGFVKLARFR